ncbi:hypothetical protein EV383_5715 [Pseudonocardia sediminis]|uniref:Uncharacterized protein n=1 Tax=Pseudonocardia sediminis TaxID=1397368 RepID=A0A4Q7V7N1_PSEST|nr:hypothetical protein EV383_5715 [Pseudonocardia sediminis]
MGCVIAVLVDTGWTACPGERASAPTTPAAAIVPHTIRRAKATASSLMFRLS